MTEWNEDETQVGTPSMVLMPSRNYAFSVSKDIHVVTVPRKGTYYDLDPAFFSKEDGEFNLYDSSSGVMFLPALSKVLFATKKYPNLDDHQLFAPTSSVFKEDVVEISGYVVNMKESEDETNQEQE